MNQHDLDNMIFNLEQRKKLKKVEVSQKGVIELLSYLKELKGKETALKTLQETLNATQGLREELIIAVKEEVCEKIIDYINSYNSFVYAYVPKEPLLEYLNSLEKGGKN